MKLLNNDKGYTLLFTFGLLVLFSILAIALFTFTSSGLSRNEVRENTSQSNDLAEKGITYFTEVLNKDLESKMSTITASSKIKPIFNFYGKTYGCPALVSVDNTSSEISKLTEQNSQEITSETGKSKICISKIENGSSEYSRLLTFRSIGDADGTKKTHYAQAEIGYKYIPGVLNYAVSTNKGGSLYLFGGSEIRGNVKVAGKMYVRDRAFWSSTNQPRWAESVLPRVISPSSDPNSKANIFVNDKKIYKFKKDLRPTDDIIPSEYITKTNPTIPSDKVQTINQSSIGQGLFLKQGESGPTLQTEKPDNLTLNIKERVEAVGSRSLSSGNFEGTELLPPLNNFNGAINRNDPSVLNTGEGRAQYIRGNMRIGRFSANGNGSNNSGDYNDFNLRGNYYVNGNVVISGAKLKGNAVLYVKGSVDIEFSTINEDEPTNTLFIFAEGPIEIHNISVNSNPGKGSIINGFFYSNSNFLMYGVGSNTTITGGVSAVNTTFTALRGHSVDRMRENDSSASDLNSSNPNPTNSCDINDEDSDGREGNYEYMFDMIDTTKTVEWLNALKNAGRFSKPFIWDSYSSINIGDSKNLSDEEIENLTKLITTPGGNLERLASSNDKGKKLYKNIKGNWEHKRISDSDVNNIYVKELNISPNHLESLLGDLNHLVSYWNSISSINNFYYQYYWYLVPLYDQLSLNNEQFNHIHTTMTLLYNVLNELYGDGNSISEDECADWREDINTGGNSSGEGTNNTGGINYPSRLTIIYDEELITRYLDTNEIELENTEISVLPGTVRSLSIK